MKKKVWIYSCGFILLLLALAIVLLQKYPPLISPGHSYSNIYPDSTVEIQNTGFANIHIKEVLVNDSQTPGKVKLGASRSGHLVVGGGLDEDPDISFHNITDLPIKKELSVERMNELFRTNDRTMIIHYGIRVWHNEPIETVTIKYSYLGIPMTMKKDLN